MGMWDSKIVQVALYALVSATTVDAECLLPEIWIDSENVEGIAGCYNITKYSGVYGTTVWTLEGVNIAAGGTSAILADVLNGSTTSNAEPTWSIGAVVANPADSWSDGYSSGLVVTTLVCAGTSPFWQLEDPTEETQWTCDSNNDGTLTVEESDLTITCGCPEENGVMSTSTFTPTPSTVALVSPSPASVRPSQSAILAATPSPVAVISSTVEPTTAINSTTGDLETTRNVTDVTATPSPSESESKAAIAVSCNLTLVSETLDDVAGCYVGFASSNTRGRWVKPGGSASIEWKDAEDDDPSTSGFWVIQVSGNGGPDVRKCINSQDEDDPTTLDTTEWLCDDNFDSVFSLAERGDFDGLKCSKESCDVNTVPESVQEDTGGSDGSTTAIIAGTVVGGLLLAGLILVGLFAFKRRRISRAKGIEPSTDKVVTVDPNAPSAPVPIFEPWGTRPPPKYYG